MTDLPRRSRPWSPPSGPRSWARVWAGLALGVTGLAALTAALVPQGSLTDAALLYLVPVVAVAGVGGVWPGLAAAAAGGSGAQRHRGPAAGNGTAPRRSPARPRHLLTEPGMGYRFVA